MPRPLRPIAESLVYHVINRGNNRAPVFRDEDDYATFLNAIGELKERRPFEFYGYCLMPNHVHLLIRPRETPISRIMQSLLVSHTHRYHRNHGSSGHVWEGRYKSPVIQDDGHLLTVLRHIEANPVRAGMVTHPGDYRWSSFAAHGLGRPDHLLDRLVVYDDLANTSATRCTCWAAYVQKVPDDAELTGMRRCNATGLPFGDPDWVEQLGARLGLDLTIRPRGRPRKVIPDDEQVERLFQSGYAVFVRS